MEVAADLKVPLIVDLGVGMNWDEAPIDPLCWIEFKGRANLF